MEILFSRLSLCLAKSCVIHALYYVYAGATIVALLQPVVWKNGLRDLPMTRRLWSRPMKALTIIRARWHHVAVSESCRNFPPALVALVLLPLLFWIHHLTSTIISSSNNNLISVTKQQLHWALALLPLIPHSQLLPLLCFGTMDFCRILCLRRCERSRKRSRKIVCTLILVCNFAL